MRSPPAPPPPHSNPLQRHYTPPALADLPFDALIRSMSALGRLGQPVEIAAVVAFLLSPDASYIRLIDPWTAW